MMERWNKLKMITDQYSVIGRLVVKNVMNVMQCKIMFKCLANNWKKWKL